METKITYFEQEGIQNSATTLAIVRNRLTGSKINKVIVASTHGFTALEAANALKDLGVAIIAVSISPTFADQGWDMKNEERQKLEQAGIKVLTTLHALADGVDEGFYGRNTAGNVMAETLRCFCQGMKVAVEIAIMAAEAGLIDINEEIISIGGSGEGCDTAIVARPAYARKVKDFKVCEILCKPRVG